jgi:hypothetical protein
MLPVRYCFGQRSIGILIKTFLAIRASKYTASLFTISDWLRQSPTSISRSLAAISKVSGCNEGFSAIDDEKCDKCAQKRNAMVHSYWTPKEDGSGLRLRIKRSNVGQPFETERITITPEELEADITFFKTTQKELGDFLF